MLFVPDQEESTLVYRRRAAELEELAARTCLPESRDRYLRMADEWRQLANSSDVMSERWGGKPAAEPQPELGPPSKG